MSGISDLEGEEKAKALKQERVEGLELKLSKIQEDVRGMLSQYKALTAKEKEVRVELKKLKETENDEEREEEDLPPLERSDDAETIGSVQKWKLSQVTKLRKFTKGENFSIFCDRFMEFVKIANIKNPNLHMFLLQNLDDHTYSLLHGIELSKREKSTPELFCNFYKAAIYGDEAIALKNDLISCRQKDKEEIEEYAFRLREKSNIAYLDKKIGEENCLLAFLRGVKSKNIKQKLNEASFETFQEAVRQAKKIEGVEKMMMNSESSNVSNLTC